MQRTGNRQNGCIYSTQDALGRTREVWDITVPGHDGWQLEIRAIDMHGQEVVDERRAIGIAGTLMAVLNVTADKLCEYLTLNRSDDEPDVYTSVDFDSLTRELDRFQKV